MTSFYLPRNAKDFASIFRIASSTFVLVTLGGLLGTSGVGAQATGNAPIPLPRISGAIVLDGVGDEAAWGRIPPLSVTQHEPVFGAEPTERTVVRVAYDREHIYMVARLFDRQPEQYRNEVLPPEITARVAVEAASPFGWERYTGSTGTIIGIDRFGSSAPGGVNMEKFGFTPENIARVVEELLN